MSRCFPFPPPGYEKTARPDAQLASHLQQQQQQQQLDKEKNKEKKHKKEKKEKDKKEGKEKKDKDRSKDKHKDKKDRKEKHKDKKKDKSKEKNRESGEGIERHDESLHDSKVGESSRRSEENKDIKFREDLVRKAQTQDEKGAASRPVDNYAISNDRNRGGFSTSPAMEGGRSAVNKTHIPSSNVSRKNEGLGQQSINVNQQKNGTSVRLSENITASAQRSAGGFTPAPTMEERFKASRPPSNTEATPRKEKIGQRISNISILVQKRAENAIKDATKKEVTTASPLLQSPANNMHKGNGKVGRPLENTTSPMQRFDSPSTSSAAAGMDRGVPRPTIASPSITMDRGVPRSTIPSPSITIRRPNGMVRPIENFPAVSPGMGKEKEQSGRLLQANVTTDQKLAMSKPPTVDKAADGRAERIEKVRDGAPDVGKKQDKKSDRHEKKKRKEKDKHKEKKKEKEAKKEKGEHNHKEHDKLRESSLNYPANNLHFKPSAPPVAPPVDDGKPAVPDENLKKRKNHETNGYLQNHHDMRPTKLPRPALPDPRVENGTASHVAAPLSSVKPEAIKIEKAERLHKEEKVNGNQQGQPSVVDPVAAYENGMPSRKSPHPDCKYLSQIYSIPEAPQMTEWPEHEGEGWLFDQGSSQSKKPKSEPVDDAAPQVWAQALRIDPADVVALPYVIPF